MTGSIYPLYAINSLYSHSLSPSETLLNMQTTWFVPRKGYKGEWIIDLPQEKRKEVIAWCREHLGEPGNDRKYHWRATWALMNEYGWSHDDKPRIFLRRESDVTLFMLKWSSNEN